MEVRPRLLEMPLSRLKDVQTVPERRANEIQARFKTNYVDKVAEYLRDARLCAERVRDTLLY